MKRDTADVLGALVAGLLPSERVVLGAIDHLGPLDSAALAVATGLPAARATADRLVALGLLQLEWPGGRRRPWFALTNAAQAHVSAQCPKGARR